MASEVLAKLIQSLARYDSSKGRFRAWLKTVVNHAITDWHRREGKEPVARGEGFDELLKHLPDPAAMAELFDELGSSIDQDFAVETQAIDRVRSSVEPHRWEAFVRTVVEGEKPADVARSLGRNPNEIYQAKFFVLKRLREEYEELRSGRGKGPPPL